MTAGGIKVGVRAHLGETLKDARYHEQTTGCGGPIERSIEGTPRYVAGCPTDAIYSKKAQ